MTIARRALPELLGRPRILWPRVLQVHLGAASLATNTDIGVVHGEMLVHLRRGVTCARSAPWSRPVPRSVRD